MSSMMISFAVLCDNNNNNANNNANNNDGGGYHNFVQKIRRLTKTYTVVPYITGGRCVLRIHPMEQQHIPVVIQKILDNGKHVYLPDRVKFPFYSKYSETLHERRRLEDLLYMLKIQGKSAIGNVNTDAWKSFEAKMIMHRLQKLSMDATVDWTTPLFNRERELLKQLESTKTRDRDMMIAQFVAIQEAITQKYDRTRSREDQPDQETTSSSNVTTTIRTKQEKNTSQECVICLEREANTMVLPCEHAVVCKACSDLLKNTPNQHLCVYCRQKIDHVLD